MINELLFMNGYGVYVLSAFSFTLFSFTSLYFVTKKQFVKEQNKFVAKFGVLIRIKLALQNHKELIKKFLANATNN